MTVGINPSAGVLYAAGNDTNIKPRNPALIKYWRWSQSELKVLVWKWGWGKQERKEKRRTQMAGIIALVIAIPVILVPAAFVWYLNAGGLVAAYKAMKAGRKATAKVKI